jgi:hypothetical protein
MTASGLPPNRVDVNTSTVVKSTRVIAVPEYHLNVWTR